MPLPVNHGSLINELRATLTMIDKQIQQIKDHTASQINLSGAPLDWQQMQDRNGNFLATPLLVAKAQCLSAIASLQAKR